MVFVPLQIPGGLGGLELVIVFLVIFLLSAPVLALIAVALGWVGWRSRETDRIAELERKVETLEAEQVDAGDEQVDAKDESAHAPADDSDEDETDSTDATDAAESDLEDTADEE